MLCALAAAIAPQITRSRAGSLRPWALVAMAVAIVIATLVALELHRLQLPTPAFLTAVFLSALLREGYESKLAQREGLDFAAGTLAAAMTGSNERPDSVRLVMGSVASAPKSLTHVEHMLADSGLTDETIEAAAGAARQALGEVTNLFTPSGYKRRLVRNFVRAALIELRDQQAANGSSS